ncbi:Hypothetical predicted protein [Pelobates cultripes]|uniref:Uncharacterized protein n=1 Tax=Pelobates cultripes TaxID=61616 RepID=A0AAD1WKI6_PELCU|nr:Hypothetical predicted protein [Pelobates cultripes]
MEDSRRWKNVKVRGLTNNIEAAESPHFFRSMLLNLFNAKQAKAMLLDGCYRRIPVSPKTTAETSRNVIICFQNGQDRLTFMTVVRNKSPYKFEDRTLTFFPDLSKATLDRRRAL